MYRMKRKIESKIKRFWEQNPHKALLVTGARQIGKTYSIRRLGKENFKSFVEINLIENKQAVKIFETAESSQEILLRISALSDQPLIPGETLIFIDEVQEAKELVTAVKFLVEDGRYQYVLSGSLLGVELQDIRSVPVGYMEIFEMFPMDFEEFATANQVAPSILENLRSCFNQNKPVDPIIHEKMLELFRLYLIVGGMPAAVSAYIETNDLKRVEETQQGILRLYKKDIAKYDPSNKLYLEDIFESIPGELNQKNKRFILKTLNENFKFSRYENSFIWLKNAGVALPAFCVHEPTIPLTLSKAKNLFKLFLSDVGLLASMYTNGIQLKILSREKDINFGSIYENAAAQELKAHGYDLFYFNSKKQGELDFVIEQQGHVLPIEIKSGKDYQTHSALNKVLSNPQYDIPQAFVFSNENISQKGKIQYYPIYMLMFLEKHVEMEETVYKPDFSVLMDPSTIKQEK